MDQKGTHKAYVSLGSNIEDRMAFLRHGVDALSHISVTQVVCSPVFETSPVGPVAQSDFLNLVVQLNTAFTPLALLRYLLDIEAENHRVREVRFGPRTLDMDILLYDNLYVCYRDLQIPHSRMWERAFVLVPLSTLAPNRRGPGGETIMTLAKRSLAKGAGEGDVRYVGRFW
jgi:2-amino-4-hydroxy-6-hydroxymethyldihydropteridine diphosphokinase